MHRFLQIVITFCTSFFYIYCENLYLNQWAVHVEGGNEVANRLAERHGFENIGQIGSIDDHYLFVHRKLVKRSTSSSPDHHSLLHNDPEVKWVEQQVSRKRVKRDFQETKSSHMSFQDPLWSKQWYFHGGAAGDFDMNIVSAWERGYSGKGIVVTILDDGIEHNHPDLQNNYDPDASYDINGQDADPMPRYDSTDENRHGTRCAGEVAAIANNSQCTVGAAFNAKIGGVRMLDGDVSDVIEAKSIGLNPGHIDIYSASWGPDDNGKVVDGPARLAKKAFVNGILKGRGGKGSIYVWASGNGGLAGDSCNCDGYTNSIYTLSISSADEHGRTPWYLEQCSSTLATTYSSGDQAKDRQIVTTDLHHRCTERHTGTSASAPMAAGICALALEANPDLGWRDMQYITLLTARPEPLYDGDWTVNAKGRKVSLKYGYGLMDAAAMVELAEQWTPVPDHHICMSPLQTINRHIDGSGLTVTLDHTACDEGSPHHIKYLEHVQAKVSLEYSQRGALAMTIISPSGTRSELLKQRLKDDASGEFRDWPFMSVHFWGEDPAGIWTLEIENLGSPSNSGTFKEWRIIFYGTAEQPINIQEPRKKSTDDYIDTAGSHNRHRGNAHEKENESQSTTAQPTNDQGETHDKSGKLLGDQAQECHPECAHGCSGPGPDDCMDCMNFRGPGGRCISKCGIGMYAQGGVCLQCSSNCASCKSFNSCLRCNSGYYIDKQSGLCVKTCGSGFYADKVMGACVRCNPNCLECQEKASMCTLCDLGETLGGDGICRSNCPYNQYRNRQNQCKPCDNTCNGCTGPTSKDCVKCVVSLNGECYNACPSGYYQPPNGFECLRCHSSCGTCRGPQDTDCTRCNDNRVLTDGACRLPLPAPEPALSLISCNGGEYRGVNGACEVCHADCIHCTGGTRYDCTQCAENRFLDQTVGCVQTCPDGYFGYVNRELVVQECQRCHQSCFTCKGPHRGDCTKCHEGQYLDSGVCFDHCGTGEFQIVDGTCGRCHSSCLNCHGPRQDHCISCAGGTALYQSMCLDNCPANYFKTAEHECQRCHSSCQTCHGENSRSCLSCDKQYSLVRGSCVEAPPCPEGFFHTQFKNCSKCASSCKTCTGSGATDCTSCSQESEYMSKEGRCVKCCSETNPNQNCCKCHSSKGGCIEERTVKYANMAEEPTSSSSVPSYIGAAIFSVFLIIILFVVIFGLLQARSRKKFCWQQGYEKLPMYYANGAMTTVLPKERDYVDEDSEVDEFVKDNTECS